MKRLRYGFTTGACAAAAAKAATLMLFKKKGIKRVDIRLPEGRRVTFDINDFGIDGKRAWASVIKDAGDDPDVTDGAEIRAEVKCTETDGIVIKGGKGIGVVTKPGLPVPVGEPAINPVPKMMIEEAVLEAISQFKTEIPNLEVIISVPEGERLAEKTLNPRLGIIGGISILGTTGIVKPISSEAWCATITISMDVAKAIGLKEIVLSTGRSSEKAMIDHLKLPKEAYVMMGDYIEFSLKEAERHGFKRLHIGAQFAKMLKIAIGFPIGHVRYSTLNTEDIGRLLKELGLVDTSIIENANTAREVFDWLCFNNRYEIIKGISKKAELELKRRVSGIDIKCYLVSYMGGRVIETVR